MKLLKELDMGGGEPVFSEAATVLWGAEPPEQTLVGDLGPADARHLTWLNCSATHCCLY